MRQLRLGLILGAILIGLSACAGNPTPGTPTAGASMLNISGEIAEGARRGLKAANDVSALLATLPLSQAERNVYNCAVLRVIGAAPSDTVTTACGAGVPTVQTSPLAVALATVQAASTCASIRSAASQVLTAVDPLIVRLKASPNQSIAFAGVMLEALLAFERRVATGEAPCRS